MDSDNFMLLQVSKCGDYCIMITNMMAGAKWYEDGDVLLLMMMMTNITVTNHKNHNFLACGWFKNVLFSTNSLAKLLSDSLLLDSLLLDSLLSDSLLSDSLISQSHSKM